MLLWHHKFLCHCGWNCRLFWNSQKHRSTELKEKLFTESLASNSHPLFDIYSIPLLLPSNSSILPFHLPLLLPSLTWELKQSSSHMMRYTGNILYSSSLTLIILLLCFKLCYCNFVELFYVCSCKMKKNYIKTWNLSQQLFTYD